MPKPVPNTQTGSLRDNQHGTNDALHGVDSTFNNPFYGDAFAMYDHSRGGNDTLIGGNGASNFLYGAAFFMFDDTRGGNDTLIGGAGIGGLLPITNLLYGDAQEMHNNAGGGNDTLIGGNGACIAAPC